MRRLISLAPLDTSSPYSLAWANVAAGSYTLSAKATDNQGGLKARYAAAMQALKFDIAIPEPDIADEAKWTCLTPQNGTVNTVFKNGLGAVSAKDASTWRMKVVESIETVPNGWHEASFDDSSWVETDMPIAWPLNHTALFRTTFEVDSRNDIEALRIRMNTYRQQNVQIFINGKLVAKVNEASNNNELTANLTEQAVKELKTCRNTIAVTTLNNWRWGGYMDGCGLWPDKPQFTPEGYRILGQCFAEKAVVLAGAVYGEVNLPGFSNDNMVLQRDRGVPVWGWAACVAFLD